MFDIGTIGGLPCEVSLSKILREKNDSKLTGKVTKILLVARRVLRELEQIKHEATFWYLRNLHWENMKRSVEEKFGVKVSGVPSTDPVVSHTMCCLHAYFAQSLEQFEATRTKKKDHTW